MSKVKATVRRRTLLGLGGAAAASVLLGALAWMPSGEALQRAEVGRLILPAFASKADLAALIMVTTKEEAYHLVRNDDGWVLAEKGSYPVTDAKIQDLTEALSHIAYGQPMTRDERKFDRIGLGDPASGGTGALLEVGDGKGNSFAKLLVGQRDGKSYVRKPDDLQAWEVDGALVPPLQRATAWLDLDVVTVRAEDIAGADVRPPEGPSYRLMRVQDGGFVLAPPHDRRPAVAALGPDIMAEALTRFLPVDVAPASEIAVGAPAGSHVTRLQSGVAVVVQAWRKDDRGWVTLSAATAEDASEEAQVRAAEINAKASPWAFGLTELDWSVFTTPLSAIAG